MSRTRHPYGTDPRLLLPSYPTLRDAWEAASRARERSQPVNSIPSGTPQLDAGERHP